QLLVRLQPHFFCQRWSHEAAVALRQERREGLAGDVAPYDHDVGAIDGVAVQELPEADLRAVYVADEVDAHAGNPQSGGSVRHAASMSMPCRLRTAPLTKNT